LLENPNDARMKKEMGESVFEKTGKQALYISMNDQIFQTVKVQLVALGLINVHNAQTTQGGMALFWSLTSKGQELLFQLRTVKTEKAT